MRALVAIALLALAGCSWQSAAHTLAPDEDAFARRYLATVRAGDRATATKLLDEHVRDSATDDAFAQLHALLERGTPTQTELIGVSAFNDLRAATRRVRLDYQLHDGSGYVAASFIIVNRGGDDIHVEGFHLTPLPDDLRRINAFGFAHAGTRHYLMLAWFAGELALIIYALVACARTPLRRRKWLWILFILFGIVQLSLEWTTGAMQLKPLSLQLFGIGMSKAGPYAPWILTVSLPVGALIFLLMRSGLPLREPPAPATTTPPSS